MSLSIHTLSYHHPDKERLFEALNLSLATGQKAALVGKNGTGKSTLLQIIAGRLTPTAGHLHTSERPWYVPQQFEEATVAQAMQVDQKLAALYSILQGDTSPNAFATLADDWTIEERMHQALQSWGLGDLQPHQPLPQLSGGQRTKVFLAGIELHNPDILLLDEPTNHLDATSRRQLYDLVSNTRTTLLVVSHDRTLLNLLPLTIELTAKGLETFGGNFDFYTEQKKIQVDAWQTRLEDQTKTLRTAQKKVQAIAEQRQKQESRGAKAGQSNSLPRILAGRRKAQAEQSTAKLIDAHAGKLAGIADNIKTLNDKIESYKTLRIDIGASQLHIGKILINAVDINYSYDNEDAPLWQPMHFQIRSGDRLLIEGDNGVGKTTLLRIITGELTPTHGHLDKAEFTHLYLDQDYSMLDPDLTLYQQVRQYNTRALQEHELKSLLTHVQFGPDSFDRNSIDLSGGEKMKLCLCCLSVSNQLPDMLILDEPGNNLDMQSLEVLTTAIREFKGTLLLVSHDNRFVDELGITNRLSIQRKIGVAKSPPNTSPGNSQHKS